MYRGAAPASMAPPVWKILDFGVSKLATTHGTLTQGHVVGTPGSGFGPSGEGYFRISAFNSQENVDEAIGRIGRAFGSR